MICPKCGTENTSTMKFCGECGQKMPSTCPACGTVNDPNNKFCGECGNSLTDAPEQPLEVPAEAERKYITALFSDMSGYTAMSEKLDPEEVKEITGLIFGEITKVIAKYEGFIEKFAGDAVLALFGVPKAHEDDPVRAIKAAREIHDLVNILSPKFEAKVGRPLTMHSGVNTGLVVTGEIALEQGTHGVAGDALNQAARLCHMAGSNEIMVSGSTQRLTRGHFRFERMGSAQLKGRKGQVQVFRLSGLAPTPSKLRRLEGLRAELTGRQKEMAVLAEAVQGLRGSSGSGICIVGDAGTGKTRLLEEFQASLKNEAVNWLQGNAYAYTQNTPYYPIQDLFGKFLGVEERDSPGAVRQKLESGLEGISGDAGRLVPYLGSLFSLPYPETEDIGPEVWDERLKESVTLVLAALSSARPTLVCLEDLHWADSRTVDLLRYQIMELQLPVLFICSHRPTFSLLTAQQAGRLGDSFQKINLHELSPRDTLSMVQSLMGTDNVPAELSGLVAQKIEGNPFFLEEVINSLIESEVLVESPEGWRLASSASDIDMPATVQGVVAARLDRLDARCKRVLQEASVVGRSFLYEIILRVTRYEDYLDAGLKHLERQQLISVRSIEPDLEYFFKHALTQEAVYEGLLKKERRSIHQRVAEALEYTFNDRLPDYFESLAYHYTAAGDIPQAVKYLIKAGEKSLQRYAVQEADQHYETAFNLVQSGGEESGLEEESLIDVLNGWAKVHYFKGDFRLMKDLLSRHENHAKRLAKGPQKAMYHAWLGFFLFLRDQPEEAYDYLHRALEFGEGADDPGPVAYACAWLSWVCAEICLFDEALKHGRRAVDLQKRYDLEYYVYFKARGGMGYTAFLKGDANLAFEIAETDVPYAKRKGNYRALMVAHCCLAAGHYVAGDFEHAADQFRLAAHVAKDPFYHQFPKIVQAISYVQLGRMSEALALFLQTGRYCEHSGLTGFLDLMNLFKGFILIAEGKMSQGKRALEDAQQVMVAKKRRYGIAISQFLFGRLYLSLAGQKERMDGWTMVKNLGFLAKNLVFARKKAGRHFEEAIRICREINAGSILGQSLFGLGLLRKLEGNPNQAREYLERARSIFQECGASSFLVQTDDELRSMA